MNGNIGGQGEGWRIKAGCDSKADWDNKKNRGDESQAVFKPQLFKKKKESRQDQIKMHLNNQAPHDGIEMPTGRKHKGETYQPFQHSEKKGGISCAGKIDWGQEEQG